MSLATLIDQLLRAIAECDAARHGNAVSYGQTAESRRLVEQWIAQAQDALSHASAHLHATETRQPSHERFVLPVSRYTSDQLHDFMRLEVEPVEAEERNRLGREAEARASEAGEPW